MSRAISAATVRELVAQHSDQVLLVLVTFSHPGITTVRVVNNTQDVISRGQTYIGFPFEPELPEDLSDQLPDAQIRFSNVDRRLVDQLRSAPTPLMVMMEVILASTPDVVEVGPFEFELRRHQITETDIVLTMGYEPILDEPYPAERFTPQLFPQLFRR